LNSRDGGELRLFRGAKIRQNRVKLCLDRAGD